MKVEHKKKERIKQIAADRRTAQKFFLIQVFGFLLSGSRTEVSKKPAPRAEGCDS